MRECGVVLLCVMAAARSDPWSPGFIGVGDSKRMQEYEEDVASADVEVVVKADDRVDIGVMGKAFTLDELKRYFKFQKHKAFIVVTFDANAPSGDLKSAIHQLKAYFREAGYRRILFAHSHSMGVIIREDYRPVQVPKGP
ncbi:MAG: hypothetical protein U0941_01860 [Planctomycetaceae bacterium]